MAAASITLRTSVLLAAACVASLATAENVPDFNRDIRPILSHNCFACHGPDEHDRRGGLRLDDRDAAVAELDSGARAIVPRKPAESELVARIRETDPDLVMRLEGVIKSLYSKYDYHEYGGAPLLGVNGVSLISHGSSKDRTIKNAILRGRAFANARINEKIVARLATVKMEQVEA